MVEIQLVAGSCSTVRYSSVRSTNNSISPRLTDRRPTTMISQFFVLSPRGDTILAKQYRSASGMGAHERSHTEAFFRKIKFWDDLSESASGEQLPTSAVESKTSTGSHHHEGNGGTTASASADHHQVAHTGGEQTLQVKRNGDAPPVFKMPDGQTYFNVRRNGVSSFIGCAMQCSAMQLRMRNRTIATSIFLCVDTFGYNCRKGRQNLCVAPLS